MKAKAKTKKTKTLNDDLLPEYDFDFSKAKSNRFAGVPRAEIVVKLDPDVSSVFTTAESVNKALRGLLECLPAKLLAVEIHRDRSVTRRHLATLG